MTAKVKPNPFCNPRFGFRRSAIANKSQFLGRRRGDALIRQIAYIPWKALVRLSTIRMFKDEKKNYEDNK